MAIKTANTIWEEYYYEFGQGNDRCRLYYRIGSNGDHLPAITGIASDGAADPNGNYTGLNTAVEVEEGSGLYCYNGVAQWIIPIALLGTSDLYLLVKDKNKDHIYLEYGPYAIVLQAIKSSLSISMGL